MAMRFRLAESTDLSVMVALLADDAVAAGRETAEVLDAHTQAFTAINDDPAHQLLVAEMPTINRAEVGMDTGNGPRIDEGSLELVGFCQLSFLPGLTYAGRWRAQIEGVRVVPGRRGAGIGKQLIREAISRAKSRGCTLVQLTTDHRRTEALAFYRSLGFVDSHHGMKLRLR